MEALFGGDADSPMIFLIVGLPILGGLLIIIYALTSGSKQDRFQARLQQIQTGQRPQSKLDEKKINARRRTSDSDIVAIDQLIKKILPRREQLRLRLARAGYEVPLGRYLSICTIVGLVGAVIAMMFLPVPMGAVPFIAVVFGLGLPHMVVGNLGKRRQAKFITNFPEAIDLMVRGLKSGLPIGESIKTAGEEVVDPVGLELRRVTDAVRLGGKLEDVLWETSERLDLQDFKFFTVSLAIQNETGGNLSETLENLSKVLRGRRQLKMKIKSMSSEAKASAYIIGCLPFVVGFFIYLVNNEYVMKLFIDPRGNILLAIGGLSFLVGTTVMYKMVKFEI